MERITEQVFFSIFVQFISHLQREEFLLCYVKSFDHRKPSLFFPNDRKIVYIAIIKLCVSNCNSFSDEIFNRMFAGQCRPFVKQQYGLPQLIGTKRIKTQVFFVEISFRYFPVVGKGVVMIHLDVRIFFGLRLVVRINIRILLSSIPVRRT